MGDAALWPWLVLAGLGALHGINPGMGWLFAVALGLQEGRGRAVWRALPPLALGHALAIVLAVAVAVALGGLIPVAPLRWAVAAVLLAFGTYRLFRHRHPRYGGMRVGARQLVVWSFLMATAHGAGLMILPVVLAGDAPLVGAAPAPARSHAAHHGGPQAADPPASGSSEASSPARTTPLAASHAGHQTYLAGLPRGAATGFGVALVHTLGYLLVAAALAWLVFARLGVRFLRTGWFNLDLVWGWTLIATAIATPLL